MFVLANTSTGRIIADRLERADGWLSRNRGLIGRRALGPGEGLWLARCWGIHTLGVRFPLDVLFLDRDLRVVAVERGVRPGRLAVVHARSQHVIELGAGALGEVDLLVGDRVRLFEA